MSNTATASQQKRQQKTDYYQIVTDRIIALLDQGVPPWRKPWGSYGFARNYATNHQYTGINFLMLNFVAPYDIPLYMSRKQIKEKGGSIKKGSKAEWVYFYKGYYKDSQGNKISADIAAQKEQAGETVEHVRFLKSFPVYNVSCIDGIEIDVPEMPKRENSVIDSCESFLRELDPRPEYQTSELDRAFYHRGNDNICIPDMNSFEGSEEFYCTLFHELTHWTGHISRLNREGITDDKATFGTKLYAEEELVAEMGVAYLCAITGIDRVSLTENSAAYIQSWKTKLEEDKKLIFRVAAKAQQAIDFLTKKS